MLQIATFLLPTDASKANEFLAKTKPDSVNYNDVNDGVLMTVAYDDGTYPAEYEIVELRNLIQAARAAQTQQTVARGVLEMELDKLSYNKDKKRWEEKSMQIKEMDTAIGNQDAKIAVVQKRIDELTKALK